VMPMCKACDAKMIALDQMVPHFIDWIHSSPGARQADQTAVRIAWAEYQQYRRERHG